MVTQIGRFDILRTLGSDAAATVFVARDPQSARLVTVTIPGPVWPEEALRSDFLRGPTLAARVHHPNVTTTVEIGEHEKRPFYAMEYPEDGETLHALLRKYDPPPLDERLHLIDQLCTGLAALHEAGVVHGDIAPWNLMVTPDGTLKIGGFSAAGLAGAVSKVVGSVHYLAPEWSHDRPLDRRVDIYAAGAVLYEVIALRQAFPGSTFVPRRRPPLLSELVPDIDPDLERIVDRAMDPDPAARYADGDTMRRDIESVRRQVAEQNRPRSAPPPARVDDGDALSGRRPVERAVPLDEVQFTVYRPKAVRPQTRYPMLVFTHLADQAVGSDERTPIEQVRERAKQALGADARIFRDTTSDAKHAVPEGGEITLIPDVPGIEFTPDRHVFEWTDEVHEHSFELEAGAELDGRVARGRLAAYLGVLLLAEVDLAIQIDASLSDRGAVEPSERSTARAYRKIFASYSRRDQAVVEQVEQYVQALGDRYLRDVRDLRSGEKWQEALLRLIDEADVFQLFWSSNAMRSPNVRREWEYALSLNRPSFIRPTYWEVPLPESRAEGLPPETLRQLHFHRLGVRDVPAAASFERRVDDDDTSQLRREEIERTPTIVTPAARRPASEIDPVRPARRRQPLPRASEPAWRPVLRRTRLVAAAASVALAVVAGTLVLRYRPADPASPPAVSEQPAPAPTPAPPQIAVNRPEPARPAQPIPPTPAPAPVIVQPSPPPSRAPAGGAAADIRRLLDRYVAAYRQMDEDAIRAIDPGFRGLPSRSQVKAVDVRLSKVQIDVAPDGESAVVTAAREIIYQSNRPEQVVDDLRWTLRRKGASWIIVR